MCKEFRKGALKRTVGVPDSEHSQALDKSGEQRHRAAIFLGRLRNGFLLWSSWMRVSLKSNGCVLTGGAEAEARETVTYKGMEAMWGQRQRLNDAATSQGTSVGH